MSFDYAALAVGLGVAGFDSVPFVVAVTMLALGVRRRNVAGYMLLILLVPVAVGVGLARVLGPWLSGFDFRSMLRTGVWPPLIEVLVALILILVAWRRLKGAPTLLPEITLPENLGWGAQVGLAGFALGGVLTDPAYLTFLVASAKQPVSTVVVGQLLWVAVSEILLLIAAVLLLTTGLRRIDAARETWARNATKRRRLFTYSMLFVAAMLLLDVVMLWVRGNYLWWG